MTEIDNLNARFGLSGELVFREGEGGLLYAAIDNGDGSAEICLQGGHVLSWHPRSQKEPVIWLSEGAKFAPGQSIRGGVPVCWPWFGPHDADVAYPAHGFVRTAPWQVSHSGQTPDGATEITMHPLITDSMAALWPYRTALSLRVAVGKTLKMEMTTVNRDERAVVVGEALHTYFRVGDIAETRVHGLDGVEYLDKLQGYARLRQTGAVGFTAETDRVYVNTDSQCAIEDPILARRVAIAKSGSLSTVVWNPWDVRAAQMGDLGAQGWRRMVCVESANAQDNRVTIEPGGEHTLAVEYCVEPLA